MKAITPYLTFDGNAGEAMKFYHDCLGGEFQIQTFGESGAGGPPGSENRVMHARITIGKIMLMASDSMPGHNFVAGTNFSIALECEDNAEQDKHFGMLSDGGKVTMPLQDTF